jgi:UPF0716 protein FxsA
LPQLSNNYIYSILSTIEFLSINDSVRVDIMNLKKIIPVFLLLIPIIEIILFIEIGSMIGSFNTILIIFGTALIGIYIIKYNAATYMSEIRSKLMNGLRPDQEILSGIIIFICGVLLLLPGFLTDSIGLLFLYKPIRLLGIKRYSMPSGRRPNSPRGRVIDVEHNKDE